MTRMWLRVAVPKLKVVQTAIHPPLRKSSGHFGLAIRSISDGMSQVSLRTFLVHAKERLLTAPQSHSPLKFVVGNESADLDSITCALVYGYLTSNTNNSCIPVTNIPASDLSLRPELAALLRHADLEPTQLITLDDLPDLDAGRTEWTLVDHNAMQGRLGSLYADKVTGCIDHHDDEGKVPKDGKPRIVEKAGSCNSLVANYCRSVWDKLSDTSSAVCAAHGQDDSLMNDNAFTSTWNAQVAKLALASILIDTINMTAQSKVTDHDNKAVLYLTARINSSPKIGKSFNLDNFYEEINSAKSDIDSLSAEDILRKDYKQWSEGSLTLGISSVVKSIEYMQGKSDDLPKTLKDFAEARKLDVVSVMTAYTSDSGDFARQLLVMPMNKKASSAVAKFTDAASKELNLHESGVELASSKSDTNDSDGLFMWDQRNLDATRKRVGPLMREAMK